MQRSVGRSSRQPVATSLSTRTLVVGTIGIGVAAIISTLMALGALGAGFDRELTLIARPVFGVVLGLLSFALAHEVEDARARGTWKASSFGLVAFGLADGVWLQWESSGTGLALALVGSALYMVAYTFLSLAPVLEVMRSGKWTSERLWPAIEAASAVTVLGVGLWLVVIGPVIAERSLIPAVAMDLALVVVDLVALALPAFFLLITHLREDSMQGATVWMVFSSAALVLAVADTGWFIQQLQDGWRPGSLVDFSYMTALALFAVAASVAVDEQRRDGHLEEAQVLSATE